MNMFARFDENPAMTLQDIKETIRYGRTHGRTDARTYGRTHGQRENSIPHHKQSLRGGYNKGNAKYSFRCELIFYFLTDGIHIWHVIFNGVDYNESSRLVL